MDKFGPYWETQNNFVLLVLPVGEVENQHTVKGAKLIYTFIFIATFLFIQIIVACLLYDSTLDGLSELHMNSTFLNTLYTFKNNMYIWSQSLLFGSLASSFMLPWVLFHSFI